MVFPNNANHGSAKAASAAAAFGWDAPAYAGAPVCILTNSNGRLTKVFRRGADGMVHKEAAATLTRGTFAVNYISTLKELDAILEDLSPNQAVTYGRPEQDAGSVVAQSIVDKVKGAITRTRDNWSFAPGPGIMMFDYDPAKNAVALTPNELIECIRAACPFLKNVGMLWRPSSSSGVDGVGITGQRIYILVDDAAAIPRIGKVICNYLWLHKNGRYDISKSGHLLERTLVDALVWQPERIDFAAAPALEEGISRNQYSSQAYPGEMLVAASVSELTQLEMHQLTVAKANARAAVQEMAESVRAKFQAELVDEMTARYGREEPNEYINHLVQRAVVNHLLMGDWVLQTSSGEEVTVGEILDNPEKWHGTVDVHVKVTHDFHRILTHPFYA